MNRILALRQKFYDSFRNLATDSKISVNLLTFDWEHELTNEQREKLIYVKNEFLVWKSVDTEIPDGSSLRKDHWIRALSMPEGLHRLKHWTFLARSANIAKRENDKKIERLKAKRADDEEGVDESMWDRPRTEMEARHYAYGHNAIFQRIQHAAIVRWKKKRWPNVLQHSPKIVIDLDLMSEITHHTDWGLTSKQLLYTYNENYIHRQPCDLIFTGYDPSATWAPILKSHFYPGGPQAFPFCTVSEKSVFDLFPRENLVYLSPNAPHAVEKFDSEKIYIIGAMVDKNPPAHGVSLARAKRMNVECQKLPLDLYLEWEKGHKSLPINLVLKILLDVHLTNDWRASLLATVPARRLRPSTPEKAEGRREFVLFEQQRQEFLLSLTELPSSAYAQHVPQTRSQPERGYSAAERGRMLVG